MTGCAISDKGGAKSGKSAGQIRDERASGVVSFVVGVVPRGEAVRNASVDGPVQGAETGICIDLAGARGWECEPNDVGMCGEGGCDVAGAGTQPWSGPSAVRAGASARVGTILFVVTEAGETTGPDRPDGRAN